DAIVEGTGHGEVPAQHFKLIHQRDGVADTKELLRLLAAGNANVDEQVMNLRWFRFAFPPHEMGCHVANHATDRTRARMNIDALRLGNGGVDPADPAHVDETL